MQALPYEPQAAAGEQLPQGLEYPDQILYLMLRCLYSSLKAGTIDRESAMAEKRQLMEDYRVYKFQADMGKHWADVIKETEAARAEYRKSRTLENADKMLKAMEGMK